jgi:hypothetical protein
VIIGNTVLLRGDAGRAFFRGLAGERFAVRNSGASAVVEGVGDHGCEYMTGGRAVILGPTGRNFAAGMSGGVAYVLDEDGTFGDRCNMELVGFDPLEESDVIELHELIEEHHLRTQSPVAARILRDVGRDAAAVRQGHAARLQARAGRAGARTRRESTAARLRAHGGGRADGRGSARFLDIERSSSPSAIRASAADYREFVDTLPVARLREQGARCMECGVPFCHNGCPLGNLIPDWNDLVYRDRWREAIDQLHATNNFPEFTGRCARRRARPPCVLEIREGDAVTIKQIEVSIINRAFDEGWVVPRPPSFETGPQRRGDRRRPVGPGGRAAAAPRRPRGDGLRARRGGRRARALRRAGLQDREVGRRAAAGQLRARACGSSTASTWASTSGADELRERSTPVVIATGSRVPRDLPVPGRELDGVHYAMEYLYGRNRWVAGNGEGTSPITAAGKHVIVIGGGDTGADCVGNSHREGAASVTQIELLGEPPARRRTTSRRGRAGR